MRRDNAFSLQNQCPWLTFCVTIRPQISNLAAHRFVSLMCLSPNSEQVSFDCLVMVVDNAPLISRACVFDRPRSLVNVTKYNVTRQYEHLK